MPPSPSSRIAPGPRGHPLAGSYFAIQRDPLGFFVRMSREYGHLFRFHGFHSRDWYHVSHPEYLEHVLQRRFTNYPKGRFGELVSLVSGHGVLAMDGQEWSERRRTIQPAFHRDRLAGLAVTMTDEVASLIDEWDRRPDRPRRIDLLTHFSRLTLQVAARTLFGADIRTRGDEVYRSFLGALEYLNYRLVRPFALPTFVPTPINLRYRAAVRRLNRILEECVGAAHASPPPPGSVMAMLLEARDEANQPLSDLQLREEVRTAFAAAHETTAAALFWSFALLAQHPDCEHRVHEEVDQLEGLPTLEDLPRLPYTRAVIDEAMRLYPSVFWQGRVAREDDEIGGFRVPAGSPVVLGFYVTHRHPDFWEHPDRFDPDRFAAGAGARPRGAYLPFGLGPRYCVGNHFAQMETLLVVASIARRYRLLTDDGMPVQPEILGTLRPRRGAMFRLEPR